ncbi:MAG: hypothetical protein ACE5GK_06195 [Nitrospiria bacterium]
MDELILTNSEEILQTLSKITLKGEGFVSECLVGEVLDAGISTPDYFKATGVDPNAYFDGRPNAWSDYHVRESKKVFMVYGGVGKARRSHIADTP